LEYNQRESSYEKLLEIFFDKHSPEYDVRARQYISAIFYHDEKQKNAALAALEQEQKIRGVKLYTLILPYEKLYLAEAYHQKYYMQMVDVLKNDIRSYYTNFRDFIDSTAAARINGYLKGLGRIEQMRSDIDSLGLSDKGKKRLIEIVDSY
jgi:peptide-methionine (S)-S-oxide reductase